MTAYTDAAASLPLYDEALELWTTFEERELSDDIEILDEVTQAALRAGKPKAALKWFEHLPEAASELAERRRELQSSKRR